MNYKKYLLIALVLFCGAALFAIDTTALQTEKDAVISLENTLVKGFVGNLANMKGRTPIGVYPSMLTWSFDLSFGGVATPYYYYRSSYADFNIMGAHEPLAKNNEGAEAITFGVGLATPANIILNVHGGYFPKIAGGNTTKEVVTAGVTLYYRLKEAELLGFPGVDIGLGYCYSQGGISRTSSQFTLYPQSTKAAFDGSIGSSWNYNIVNAEIFINQNNGIMNVYSRGSFYALLGEVKSTISGTIDGASASGSLSDTNLSYGVVTSGGMEFFFLYFYLNLEAGIDWFTHSVYGNGGIRFEI